MGFTCMLHALLSGGWRYEGVSNHGVLGGDVFNETLSTVLGSHLIPKNFVLLRNFSWTGLTQNFSQ